MSEDKSRFRIKKGDTEIEFEGKSQDVNARYKEAFDWVKSSVVVVKPPTPSPDGKKKKTDKEKSSKKAKGVASEVDKLIEEGWIDEYKRPADVLEELDRRAVTGVYIQAVNSALKQRVGKTLERIKDESDNWVYKKIKT
jgi:hypothetical protein